MKDPFRRWAWYVIQILLFVLLLSTCGRLLRIELSEWTGNASRGAGVTSTTAAGNN